MFSLHKVRKIPVLESQADSDFFWPTENMSKLIFLVMWPNDALSLRPPEVNLNVDLKMVRWFKTKLWVYMYAQEYIGDSYSRFVWYVMSWDRVIAASRLVSGQWPEECSELWRILYKKKQTAAMLTVFTWMHAPWNPCPNDSVWTTEKAWKAAEAPCRAIIFEIPWARPYENF